MKPAQMYIVAIVSYVVEVVQEIFEVIGEVFILELKLRIANLCGKRQFQEFV